MLPTAGMTKCPLAMTAPNSVQIAAKPSSRFCKFLYSFEWWLLHFYQLSVGLLTGTSCRWDLVKRVPKELLDFISDRAKATAIDDNVMRSQYTACQQWLR